MMLCHVVGKFFNVNTSVIAAESLMVFGVCDVVEAVATRKDKFVNPLKGRDVNWLHLAIQI